MIGIIKDIIDVAKALFGFKEVLMKADKQKRTEMADYFQTVSKCLAVTYKKLLANEVPHDRCAELKQYAESLPQVVENFIDDKKAAELSQMLLRSHKVEGLWEKLNLHPQKREQLPVIAEAAGIFLALSNTIRTGFIPK